MTRRRSLLIAVPTIGASISGCLGVLMSEPPIDDVDIRLVDIREADRGATSVTIPIILEIANTAEREVPSPSIRYQLRLNGERITESSEKLPNIPAEDILTEEFDMIIQYTEVGETIANAIRDGTEEVSLEIAGSIESEDTSREFSDEYSYRFE